MKENNVSLKGELEWDSDSEKREHYITFIVNQLTLEEKTDMIHGAGFFKTKGVERLGIPPLQCLMDLWVLEMNSIMISGCQ